MERDLQQQLKGNGNKVIVLYGRLSMRLCDFLRKINGDFTVRLYRKDNSILREDSLDVLNEEHKKDFSPLTGFKCILWERSVLDWGINNRTINVLLDI